MSYIVSACYILTLIRMGFLGVAHGCVCVWEGGRRGEGLSLPKICHIYPTLMKLDLTQLYYTLPIEDPIYIYIYTYI